MIDFNLKDKAPPLSLSLLVNPLDYPPCVRLIVTDSKCVAVGSLHIVTVMGGTIGR